MIEAPIPGQRAVGIEVPNRKAAGGATTKYVVIKTVAAARDP